MKKSDELKQIVDSLKSEVENLQVQEQYDAAAAKAKELTDAVRDYTTAKAVEDAEFKNFVGGAVPASGSVLDQQEKRTLRNRVFNKLVFGRPLDDQELEFVNTVGAPQQVVDAAGTPGQVEATPSKGGYLVPEEQMATIREYRKAYTALKGFCHVQTANSTSGKMPTLGDEAGTLTKFEELNSIKQSDFDFGQLKYTIADYGDIIPVSNQLLADANVSLVNIIGQRFARKAVNSENAEILTLLGGLTAGAVTDYKSLLKAINVDLDPAYYASARIVTNQDGFQWMSELSDAQSRPLLVPDVAAPDTYRFRGKEIVVLSNNTLKTATKKIPFYIGSIADYVAFFERQGVEIAVSTDFLFDKYATALRCVERFGVVADDKDAVKAYNFTVA